jgi:trigger factor
MKTRLQEKSDIEYVVSVEIPSEIVDQKLEEVYRRVVRTLEIPGFRRGHIPRTLLEMRFGKDFLYEDSKAELLEAYLQQALVEHKLEPASQPKPRVLEFEAGKPFRFEIDVEVFPEVEIPDYAELAVEAPPNPRVTPKEIDQVIEELRLQHATLAPKPRDAVVQAEDVVVVRQRGGDTRELQARSEGWTTALMGKRVGESVELDAPNGQKWKVTVDGIKRIELPDVEELAKTLGHENPEALQADLREKLKDRHKQGHEQRLRMAVLDAVVERSNVRVPAGLVEDLVETEQSALRQSGRELSEEERAKLKGIVEQRLRRDRVLQALKQKENLALADSEFEEFLKQEAERRGTNLVKFKALLEREGRWEQLREERENQKILEFLVGRVQVKEKTAAKSKAKREKAEEPAAIEPEEEEG